MGYAAAAGNAPEGDAVFNPIRLCAILFENRFIKRWNRTSSFLNVPIIQSLSLRYKPGRHHTGNLEKLKK